MRWQVGIQGPCAVLHQLALAVSAEDIRLARLDAGFILGGSRLDSLSDAGIVRREAERIVAILSGSARVSLGSTGLLQVADVTEGRVQEPQDVGAAALPEALDLRRITGGPDDPNAWPKRSSLSNCVREALSNPAIEEALRLRDTDNLNWTELVQIYQVIEKAIGGRYAVAALCGVTDVAIERLHQASLCVNAVGIATNGPLEEAEPQSDSMTLLQAQSFVDCLLMAWLGSIVRRKAARR
jgi:hypothetical protein